MHVEAENLGATGGRASPERICWPACLGAEDGTHRAEAAQGEGAVKGPDVTPPCRFKRRTRSWRTTLIDR